eukprot:14956820-Alexandrium_andersonii.AAC.1
MQAVPRLPLPWESKRCSHIDEINTRRVPRVHKRSQRHRSKDTQQLKGILKITGPMSNDFDQA